MNIKDLHPSVKGVSTFSVFKGEEGTVRSLHLSKGEKLAKHQSKTNALLLCVDGEIIFENGNGVKEILRQGDYVNIESMVDHWMNSIADSYLLLIK